MTQSKANKNLNNKNPTKKRADSRMHIMCLQGCGTSLKTKLKAEWSYLGAI